MKTNFDKVLVIGIAMLATVSCASAQSAATSSATQPGQTQVACPAVSATMVTQLNEIQQAIVNPDVRPDFAAFMNNPALQTLRDQEEARRATDWAYLCRYKEANQMQLRHGAPGVVFMGDSITEFWQAGDPQLFTGGVINRGISGQTTSQMLLRFYADVVALHPNAVHLMAGTNDVAGNTGPIDDEDFKNNIRAMVSLARANNIEVMLASIPPAAGFTWAPELRPAPRIDALNQWLRSYAAETNSIYVDYNAALRDDDGGLRADYAHDGVHPHRRGYAVMRPIAAHAIERALSEHSSRSAR